MATVLRNDAKRQIIDILRKQGYPTYADLVQLFDIYLSDDPEVVGYMIPGEAKIVLNRLLNIDQVSVLVRHEILHEYLDHAKRRAAVDAKRNKPSSNSIANIAADFEISNRGYTEADKANARAIVLGDQVIRGLVTEDIIPGWEDMTFEEMYQKLLDRKDVLEQKIQKQLKELEKAVGDLSKLDPDDLQDAIDDAKKQQQDQQGERGKPSSSSQGKPTGSSDSSDASSNDSSSDGSGDSNDSSSKDGDSKDSQSSDSSSSTSGELDKLSDEAKKVAEEKKRLEDSTKDGTPLQTPSESRDTKDLARRVAEIAKIFRDAQKKEAIDRETAANIVKEKSAREAKRIERVQGSAMNKFKLNLNKFVANQIEEEEEDTYSRINPAYADSEFILPGKKLMDTKHIPIINVYWDVSGSFRDESKTAAARDAIATLNKFVRSGDIEIHVFYFASRVSETEARAGDGTAMGPVAEHIRQTKPDNVIIITDADTDRERFAPVTVPGAVWALFYGGRSNAVMNLIRGKKENKYYDIVW